ncbi:MAG: hypothetical protein IPL08_17945 [Saprospiraceae bacterium]|nr:hypothetical protein [Saprospiraceae bacterium]
MIRNTNIVSMKKQVLESIGSYSERCVCRSVLLENGKYQRLNAFSEDDIIPVKTLPGLSISIDDIFEGV